MTTITCDQLPALFEGVAALFAEKREELCDMDANMGDGDLGLTMDKGYGALPDLLRENMEAGDAGKTLMKAGMKMSSVVPSTMGTLMSSGIMEGGKALKGKAELGPAELAAYLTAFAAGIQKRGKCQRGTGRFSTPWPPPPRLLRRPRRPAGTCPPSSPPPARARQRA